MRGRLFLLDRRLGFLLWSRWRFSRCDWLLWFLRFDFFTRVIVTDFVTRAACNFRAMVAIGLETVIANQWADASGLRLDGVERVYARDLHVKLRASVLVEKVKRALRSRIPISIDRACIATDPPQFGLNRARKVDRRSLI